MVAALEATAIKAAATQVRTAIRVTCDGMVRLCFSVRRPPAFISLPLVLQACFWYPQHRHTDPEQWSHLQRSDCDCFWCTVPCNEDDRELLLEAIQRVGGSLLSCTSIDDLDADFRVNDVTVLI